METVLLYVHFQSPFRMSGAEHQSKSREFAGVGKCIRSENPAQERGTLLVYWSVPYKILTECTLIIDIKGASIHTYDVKRKETWSRLKK